MRRGEDLMAQACPQQRLSLLEIRSLLQPAGHAAPPTPGPTHGAWHHMHRPSPAAPARLAGRLALRGLPLLLKGNIHRPVLPQHLLVRNKRNKKRAKQEVRSHRRTSPCAQRGRKQAATAATAHRGAARRAPPRPTWLPPKPKLLAAPPRLPPREGAAPVPAACAACSAAAVCSTVRGANSLPCIMLLVMCCC